MSTRSVVTLWLLCLLVDCDFAVSFSSSTIRTEIKFRKSSNGPNRSRRCIHMTEIDSRPSITESNMDASPLENLRETTVLGSLSPLISPLSLSLEDLSTVLGGKGRALACWECLRLGIDPLWYYYHNGEDDESIFIQEREPLNEPLSKYVTAVPRSNLARANPGTLGRDALTRLSRLFRHIEHDVATVQQVHTSQDGTVKLLLELVQDGLEVETVLIPWDDRQSTTLCVSSQVGCLQGCQFCATSKMGKLRSLSVDEILVQLYYANKLVRLLSSSSTTKTCFPIDNVVFMGMGEPADNTESVVRATVAMTDRQMFGLASRRVTISTVAPSPESFGELGLAPATLAWSVHASRDEIRRKLVPTTKYSMVQLREGLIRSLQCRTKRLRSIMLEVTLLQHINDNEDDARHLAEFCRPILSSVPGVKVVVNLIPWNDITVSTGVASQFQSPTMDRVKAYQRVLVQEGMRCYVRTTRGDDTSAACGQLATARKQQRPSATVSSKA